LPGRLKPTLLIMFSIIILLIVFALIAVRRIGSIRFQIWQVMLFGAVAVLATGEISPGNALKAIDPDVMLFLFGMFAIGQALEESGYLSRLSYLLFSRARSLSGLVLLVLFGMGLLAALLMNDTLAIIGTPIMVLLARKNGIPGKILLLALAFAVTIGSVMSPIGNPQNLLIAINGGVAAPFITFLKFLFLPTVLNLFIAYGFLRLYYRRHFNGVLLPQDPGVIQDRRLARVSQVSLGLLVLLIIAKIAVALSGLAIDFRLTYIALISALPVLLFSPNRLSIIRGVDWHTLVFFAAMFVLMESVWDGGVFQYLLNGAQANLTSVSMILLVSVVLSQFISNVPLVALYLPMLMQLGAATKGLMALAAGSTIAGNFSILGAASNVIIIQNAEKKAKETVTFLEFIKIGVPLTIANILVYWLFLGLI
jgi:Na+/H+ antiporter NhaD/arsenite permease-like protein